MGEHVCKAVRSFFLGGYLLKELNRTNLVLIPKVANLVKLSQFRSISLCNFSLKIITKILANRLKKILKSLISPHQYAFVPERLIQDNIMVAHKAFHYLKLKKKGSVGQMAVKIDFNKAYDRVEWDFLREVLRKLGFHAIWIQWVMECVSTVYFSIFANGEKRVSFYTSRGLRQGGPLSPYLFVLVVDVLSRLLSWSLRSNQFSGLNITRQCPTISHLLFADDLFIFLKADGAECQHVLDLLRVYCKASRQQVNFDKSSIQFSLNVSFNLCSFICNLTGLKLTQPDAKYLGLSSFWGRSKVEAYEFIIEKVLYKGRN